MCLELHGKNSSLHTVFIRPLLCSLPQVCAEDRGCASMAFWFGSMRTARAIQVAPATPTSKADADKLLSQLLASLWGNSCVPFPRSGGAVLQAESHRGWGNEGLS